ncbi:xanthine dehydrogenase family protein molybdopterin-binding subunit [Streptomyces sp. TS71-3]|uniref:xanthine dehydrogenase family protein molybdopterin-binding subunit n=1 Tax=Streptomyces sp. TS71-3 TaxID=2733862 RepID=UPI001B12BA77|nr:xanthine dehydrogenase family protein molybdopterin-binding subunit [Streptomyces sp. TS71-3]GHJ42488.1 xanthine dehydrogenase [Streptomyces sp. TS71-3]
MRHSTAAPGAARTGSGTVTPPDSADGTVLGASVERREGREKVTGAARYAAEYHPFGRAYAWPVPATVARGRVVGVDDGPALDLPGVLAVITPATAPRLSDAGDPILNVLQDDWVPHRGWCVALVVAETLEAAREAAAAVHVHYETEPHDVTLRADHPDAYVPEIVNGGYPASRERGDPDAGFQAAPVRVEADYRVPPEHNHPMEPHAATAEWHGDRLTVYDSDQGASAVAKALSDLFRLPEEDITVVAEHVGGGFGSKGTPRPHTVLAAMAARRVGRPVAVVLPRRHLAATVGHRPPGLHRVRLGAEPDGRLISLSHEITTQTSRVKEFVEQSATPGRMMYGSAHSRTVHRVVPLDVPTPSWMRAPGTCPGMYALESAMDELAEATGVDPVELRLRNDTDREPDSGRPFSSRHLGDCLREGAERFGWAGRDPRPGGDRRGALLIGTGVASALYPVHFSPSLAAAYAHPDGSYTVRVAAADIGTGARTVLAQIAADALGVPLAAVRTEVGSSALPRAPLAGGSSGTASWGTAVHEACTALAARLAEHRGPVPPAGLEAHADTAHAADRGADHARSAFGAHFAEVQVDTDSGEVRIRRMLGVFAAGHVLNARTGRSQFLGGMTMGAGMALMENSTMEPAFGDYTETDLAMYHVPVQADITDLEAHWIDEEDAHLNPMGSKGIGEIGIVGTAAAIGNAVHHATGVRYRELPLTPDRVLTGLNGAGAAAA